MVPNFKILPAILLIVVAAAGSSCDGSSESGGKKEKGFYHYVSPSVDYRGRYRKGHVRKSVSTEKNAVRNRGRSRYYYHTRGKYMRKSRR